MCNVLKDIKGIQYEDVINILLEVLKESGGISDRIIRYVESVSFEKRVDGYVVINYKEKPDDKDLKLFRVPHGDVIQLTKLINGEEAGNWYEQER